MTLEAGLPSCSRRLLLPLLGLVVRRGPERRCDDRRWCGLRRRLDVTPPPLEPPDGWSMSAAETDVSELEVGYAAPPDLACFRRPSSVSSSALSSEMLLAVSDCDVGGRGYRPELFE